MNRAGRWAIEKARSERWRTVRRNVPLLVAFSAWVWAVSGLAVFLILRVGKSHLAAFLAGALVTWWVAAIASILSIDGSTFRRMGGFAERWTSKAFRKLPSASWTVFDNLRTERGDVDHVVVGPNHILAVETKWTSKIMVAHENGHLRGVPPGWLRQVKDSARAVARMLGEADPGVRVKPVLVIWGPGISRTERGWFKTGGVTVLVGKQAGNWRQHLEPASWSASATHTNRAADSQGAHDRWIPACMSAATSGVLFAISRSRAMAGCHRQGVERWGCRPATHRSPSQSIGWPPVPRFLVSKRH